MTDETDTIDNTIKFVPRPVVPPEMRETIAHMAFAASEEGYNEDEDDFDEAAYEARDNRMIALAHAVSLHKDGKFGDMDAQVNEVVLTARVFRDFLDGIGE